MKTYVYLCYVRVKYKKMGARESEEIIDCLDVIPYHIDKGKSGYKTESCLTLRFTYISSFLC